MGTYECLLQKTGSGTPSMDHAAVAYQEDKDGTAQKYPIDAVVWKYPRVVLTGGAGSDVDTAYADNGSGTLLDPQPYLSSQAFSDVSLTTPVTVPAVWDSANHDNTEGGYYCEIEYDGDDVNILKIGETPILYIASDVLYLSDAGAEDLSTEYVTNGTFDTDLTGWSTASWWVWSSGTASHPTTSLVKILEQTLTGVPTHAIITADLVITGGTALVGYKDADSTFIYNEVSASGATELISYNGVSSVIAHRKSGTTLTCTIDNYSVKSRPELDDTLLTNGEFTTDLTNWTYDSAYSWSSGKLYRDNSAPGSDTKCSQSVACVIGRKYRFEFFCTSREDQYVEVRLDGVQKLISFWDSVLNVANLVNVASSFGVGRCYVDFTATSTSHDVGFSSGSRWFYIASAFCYEIFDGTNTISTAITTGEHQIGIAWENDTSEMDLCLDGTWYGSSDAYDGSFGTGDLSTEATIRELQGITGDLTTSKTAIDALMV